MTAKKKEVRQSEYQRVSVDCCWSPHIFKKVTLVNPDECNGLTFGDLQYAWAGTGHLEWEELLVRWFSEALMEAKEEGSTTANISMLFNNDLLAAGMETYRSEDVYKHLLASGTFEVVEESEEELKLAFHARKN